MTARYLYGREFEFRPALKLWLACNHLPAIDDSTESIWRRVRLIPFDVVIPPKERDNDLTKKLVREAPAILAWAVQGCLRWQEERGLNTPKKVLVATQAYRAAEDELADFLEGRFELGPTFEVTAADLYKAYRGWTEAVGEKARSQKWFGGKLSERGFVSKKLRNGRKAWLGLRFTDDRAVSSSVSESSLAHARKGEVSGNKVLSSVMVRLPGGIRGAVMNAAARIISEARERGVVLTPEGDYVRFRGPLDSDLRERLVAHKEEILEELRSADYLWLSRSELVYQAVARLPEAVDRRPEILRLILDADDRLIRLEESGRAHSREWSEAYGALVALLEEVAGGEA